MLRTSDALKAPDHGYVADVPVDPDGKVHIKSGESCPGQHLPVGWILEQLTDGPAVAQPTQPQVLAQQFTQIGCLQLSNVVAEIYIIGTVLYHYAVAKKLG
jgi:hypothetical protein